MLFFTIASIVSYIVLLLCKLSVSLYLAKYKRKEDELKHVVGFNIAAVALLISFAIFWASITMLAALIIKTYLL